MGGIADHNSAGFGRIGDNTRPSLYTPVHLASTPLQSTTSHSGRPLSATRLLAGAAIVVLVVVAVALAAGVVLKLRPAPLATLDARETPLPALDVESDRLSRSAFATHRRRG